MPSGLPAPTPDRTVGATTSTRARIGAIVVPLMLLAAACTGASSSSPADPAPADPAPAAVPATNLGEVDAPTMVNWIDEIVEFGIRRPGYPADDETAEWIAEELRSAGISDVRLEPVEVNRWTPETCEVSWWSDAEPGVVSMASCFALPYSQPVVDMTAPAVIDDGENELSGSVGIVRNAFQTIPQNVLAAEAIDVVMDRQYLETDQHPIPFGVRNGKIFGDYLAPTLERDGAGYIGVLDGLGTDQYYAPYTGVDVDLPAVWVGEDGGAALIAATEAGPITVNISVDAKRSVVTSHNVVGSLAGPGDQAVIVGTHHDAPWASAVEDATGIAEVLAQAHHWAAVPENERPHDLVFLFTAGHMAGAAGGLAFVEQNPDLMDRTVLEVHLEHVGLRAEVDDDGGFHVTNEAETRWWFTTDRADIRSLVVQALETEDLDRDLVLPDVGFFGADGPLSDAAPFTWAGVPIVSLISAPVYLFDPRDTPEVVDVENLVPIRRVATDIIEGTAELTETRPAR